MDILTGWLAVACYGHDPRGVVPSEAVSRGPVSSALPVSASGWYAVRGPSGLIAEERFAVTSTAGDWQLRSFRFTDPSVAERDERTADEGFVLRLDAATAEPLSFRVWRRFDDLRVTTTGVREGPWLVIRSRGIGPAVERRVAYAPGTIIDAPTPTFKSVALALLAEKLATSSPLSVRTVRLDGPELRPRVTLSTLEERGHRGAHRLVRWSEGDRHAGLWVRADGWPVRMRVLDERRAPAWSWSLHAEP